MSILFATPMYGGMCTAQYFGSCLALTQALTGSGVDHDFLVTDKESLITRGRNAIVSTFLKTDHTHLMFIDADIGFSPDDVAKLWNLQVPVAVGVYPMKRVDAPLSAWVNGELVHDLNTFPGPVDVDYAGTGFMLIERSVFERMKTEKWFPSHVEEWLASLESAKGAMEHADAIADFIRSQFGIKEYEEGHVGRAWGFFLDPIEEMIHLSEDFHFCKRWREIGGRVVMDPSVRLRHVGSYVYEGKAA